MAIIPAVRQQNLEPRKIVIPFSETFAVGTLTNKTRYSLLTVNAGTEVIDVRAKLTSLVSTTASTYNFQLVAQPQGTGQDDSWKALSAEVTSKTSWTGAQALNIVADAVAELLPASPRLGASLGYGVGPGNGTNSTAIVSLPLAKGLDKVNIGFDIGNTGVADSLTLTGELEIIILVPGAKLTQPTNYIGGSGLNISLASGVNKALQTSTNDGTGFVITGVTGQTPVGTTT